MLDLYYFIMQMMLVIHSFIFDIMEMSKYTEKWAELFKIMRYEYMPSSIHKTLDYIIKFNLSTHNLQFEYNGILLWYRRRFGLC